MNQLIIKLKGEIQSSNFAEWKNDLIAQIQSVNTELTTDDDFVGAIGHVKLFKAAEHYLREAKRSAIDQSSDIQGLFAAIDEIAEKARQARLSLERQIKERKLDIKEGCVHTGIGVVRSLINQQNDDFQLLDHASYLDANRFESAVRGKTGLRGIQLAIDHLCNEIKLEILQKADETATNGVKLDSLPSKYRLLFQDRNSLISLNKQELELTIDKRIVLFNEENAKIDAENAIDASGNIVNIELSSEAGLSPDLSRNQNYRLIIDLLASKSSAIEIARSIRQTYGKDSAVSSIRLTLNP